MNLYPPHTVTERLVESTSLTPVVDLEAAALGERQMTFAAGAYSIDLRATPTPAGWIVSGQVLGSDETGEAVLAGGDTVLRTPVGADAAFDFPVTAEGRYTLTLTLGCILTLTLGGLKIVIDELGLGDA